MTAALLKTADVTTKAETDSDVASPTTDPSTPTALPGLATGDVVGKKKKKKKKKKGTGEASVEAQGTPAKETPPLDKNQRLGSVKTLTEDDKHELAVEWGLDETDDRFILATTVEKSYKFMRRLAPGHQVLVHKEHVAAGIDLGKTVWPLLRRENVATLTDEDKAALAKEWSLKIDDNRLKLVFKVTTPEYYLFFKDLPQAYRSVVLPSQIKTQVPDSKAARAEANKTRAEAAQAAKAKVEKERAEKEAAEAAAAMTARHQKAKVDFAAYRIKLQQEVSKALSAIGIDDDAWVKDFVESADKRTKVISQNKTATSGTQISGLKSEWDARITYETKKDAIEKESLNHPDLDKSTLNELKKKVLADKSLTAMNFAASCTTAMAAQRNPDVDKWRQWMRLKMYRTGKRDTMQKLSPRLGYPAHFTVDESGLSRPTKITDATTPADLLDQLFKAPSGKKFEQAHVTLETDVADGTDAAKNPHLYWRGVGPYELYYHGGTQYRWTDVDHSDTDICAALDQAMAEVYAQLLARAQVVLAAKGKGVIS